MRFRFQNKTIFYWMVKVAILIILIAGFFMGIFIFEYKGFDIAIRERFPSICFLANLPHLLDIFYLPYQFKDSPLPVYNLIIDPADFKKIEQGLVENPGRLLSIENKKSIPAEFIFNNQSYQVKIKIRGDSDNHWKYEKKSWRIRFDKDNLFEGKKEIHLIIPEDRGYILEHLNNYRAKKLGLFFPESRFVTLKINSQSPMVYFETEGWTPEFLEKSQLPDEANLYGEDDIFAFRSGHDLFEQPSYWKKYTQDSQNGIDNFSEIDLLGQLVHRASDDEFYRLLPSLIDMDNFYNWQIHSILVASNHQDMSHNNRLYFDINQGKFKFIPWDVAGRQPVERGNVIDVYYNNLISRSLKNPEFLHQRNKMLWDYVKDDTNLKDDLEFYDKTYQEIRTAFYKDRTKLFSNIFFDREIKKRRNFIINRYHTIQNVINNCQVPIIVRIFPELVRLDVVTQNFSDVILHPDNYSIYYDKNQNKIFDQEDIKLTEGFQMWSGREIPPLSPPELGMKILPIEYSFFLDKSGFNPDDFEIEVTNAVTGSKIKPVIRYIDEETFKYFEQINYSREEFLRYNPIFKKGLSDNQIVLYPGIYQISETIIIPRDFSLEIKPGSQLRFAPGASLISYSPVKAQGINQAPIIFTAQDRNKGWGVVAVLDIEKSIFEHCLVEYGGEAYINGVFFSGQLAIHYADAEIKNCRFRFAQGDDSLNIKKGRVNLENNYFYQNNFDGLDLDWANGRVANNHFLDNGNDGLDLGGVGNLIVWSNRIEGSKDKCLSIGENSKNTRVVNNLLMNCQTGIAVKDNSEVDIINNTILNNQIGVAVYEKKPTFGGASPKMTNSIVWHNGKSIELDDKSKINISFSNIEGGYPGESNLSQEPIFENEERGNYLLLETKDNLSLIKGGNLEAINAILKEKLKAAPVGLIALPSKFND